MLRRLMFIGIILLAAQVGCSTGYTKMDGKWCYVVINESVGREVREMNADESTFEVLADPEYARDKNHAYRFGRVLEDIDGSSYHLLSDTRYAADRNGVYYKDHKIPGADPKTFEIIGHPYSRDQENVYCGNLEMNVAQPENFKQTVGEPGTMEITSFYYSSEDLARNFGDSFKDAAVDNDNPAVISPGRGTDGTWIYDGPKRTRRVK